MFPPEMCKDVRKAHAAGVPAQRRATTFPGVYGAEAPKTVVGQTQTIGRLVVPPHCQSCAASLDGKECIQFEYNFYPNDHRTYPSKWHLCKEECEHAGMGVGK